MIAAATWPLNLQEVLTKIQKACEKSQRDPRSVRLLLATKTVPAEILREVTNKGYFLFGENKVQELKSKCDLLSDIAIEWHMIGHLQSNKVKDVVARCELIHSVDRIEIAQEIHRRSAEAGKVSHVLIEVNTSGEPSKHGLKPSEVVSFCQQTEELNHIKVKGLMTLAIPSSDPEKVRICFKILKEKFEELKKNSFKNHSLMELSMGMSNDFEIAVEEGATILRIGSAVFGARA